MKAAIKRLYHADTALGSFIRGSYRTLARPMVHRLRQRQIQKQTVAELGEISEVFTRNGCVWSLQSGNVLGIYRDGGFLKNEDDVDIAVLAEDWHMDIEEEIRQLGYTVSHECGGYQVGSEGAYIVVKKRGLTIDIYPTFKSEWDGISYRWYGGMYQDRYYFAPELLEETRAVDFYGVMVQIPSNTDRYLRAIYGDDYMVPNPNWDWRTQPACRLALSPIYLSQADVDVYANSSSKYSVK